jgi:hypothetical protein
MSRLFLVLLVLVPKCIVCNLCCKYWILVGVNGIPHSGLTTYCIVSLPGTGIQKMPQILIILVSIVDANPIHWLKPQIKAQLLHSCAKWT